MDPENQDHNNPQEAVEDVDNDPDNQGHNPGFNGSDESLPTLAKSCESYAEIAEESGTSTPMEQEAEREPEDNLRKPRKRRPHSKGPNIQSITPKVPVTGRHPLLSWVPLSTQPTQLVPVMSKQLITHQKRVSKILLVGRGFSRPTPGGGS